MSALDATPPPAPSRSPGPSLHGNDQQVIERRSLRDYYVIRRERVVQNEQVVDTTIRSDIDLNTNIQFLNSGRLRTMVAQSLTPDEIRLLQRPYLKDLAPGANPPAVGGLLGSMSPLSIRNSFLINITVNNRDPEGAALLANRFVEQF